MKYLKQLAAVLLCLVIAVACFTVYNSANPSAEQDEKTEETEEILDASVDSENEEAAAQEEASEEGAVSAEASDEGTALEEEMAADEETASKEEAASEEEADTDQAVTSEEGTASDQAVNSEEDPTSDEASKAAGEAAADVSQSFDVDETVEGIMYASKTVNVRSGPSTDYEKIGKLSIAQEVEVTGQADTGWYQISYNGGTGYVSDLYLTEENPKGEEYLISDFEIIYQYPELPTGCESVALTMLVNYYGVYADKLDMADNYLPKQPDSYYYDENGNKIGPDMENYFVGDPRGVGHICGVPAIMTEADTWLEAQGSELRSVDKTGISFDELYAYIREGTPVMVWVTIYMADRRTTQGWYTEDGRWMEYATNDHGAVLIGYSDTTVTIADPISGIVEYSRAQFEKVFTSRENKCIILE